jgi:polysaccharide biosynthesis transport protein
MNAITGPTPEYSPLLPRQPEGAHVVGARMAHAAPAAPASGALDPLGLWKAFRRKWRAALGLGVLGGATAALAAWYLLPAAKYTAETLLFVEPEQPRVLIQTKEARPDPENDRRTQLALIKSSVVLGSVLNNRELNSLETLRREPDPAEWLEREITAEFNGKMLRLSLSGDNPVDVTRLVNGVTQAYLSEVANKEKIARRNRNLMLEDDWAKRQKLLAAQREQVRSLQLAVGAKNNQNLSAKQQLALNRHMLAMDELLKTQMDLTHAMAELKVLENHRAGGSGAGGDELAPAPDPEEIEQAVQHDPTIQKLLAQEQRLSDQILNVERVVRQKQSDSAIRLVRRNLDLVQKQRKQLEANLRREFQQRGTTSAEAHKEGEAELATVRHRIEVLRETERNWQTEVSKFTTEAQNLDNKAVEMASIVDDIKIAEAMSNQIGNEIEALKLELHAPDRVTLLKDAKVPRTKDTSKQVRSIGMAGGGVFAGIVLLISFWEFRARRIDSLEEVIHGLGLNVVGTMPAFPGKIRASLPKPADGRDPLWQHQLIESVDTTRIMLMHRARAESLRVVLVTSAVGGEGKTSLASHLATSLARAGCKTLLLDCDLRRPSLHRIYDQPPGQGFCELVRGELDADEALRPTAVPGLWLVPAGQYDDRALSLLAQARARSLFDELRERFDFIVVDSAPVLPVADTLLLAQHVDGAVFSILREVSQVPKIQAAHARVAALGVPILGAVLAGAHAETYYRYRS